MDKLRPLLILFLLLPSLSFTQSKIEFEGQASTIMSVSPDNDLEGFIGARYIPKLSLIVPIDTFKSIDFEASINISESILFHPFDASISTGKISPYRIWARYNNQQFELRIGLQKIDFGSSTLLRPLQWFNQIDPRDPLQLTNGVYGALGRYYFKNNANIWLWALYGNKKTRGFDIIETNNKVPETGGRIQVPMARGEIAMTFHYRTAQSTNQIFVNQYDRIPESRIAIDGKWDLHVGLWIEASYSHKYKDLEFLTNQTLLNLGTDYTFGIGNGMNMILEHLYVSFDKEPFGFDNDTNITALTAAYPISFFDNISSVMYYNWDEKDFTFFVNYEHQFDKLSGYIMAYYNPSTTLQGIQQNDFVNNFTGPGIRLMLVYNH